MALHQVEEMDFLVQFDRLLRISLPVADVSLQAIKQSVACRTKVPADKLDLYENGRRLDRLESSASDTNPKVGESSLRMLRVRMTGGLLGGKGGFGAMLRSMGKTSGSKATTDFGACRDLNGRRLRHVNQEIQLQKWLQAKEAKEAKRKLGKTDVDDAEDDEEAQQEITPSGIPNWYLATPSWAEGIQPPSSHLKRRRNTVLCKYWLAARAPDSKNPPPPNAPRWYGCPRGRNCDFAHGEEELRGKALHQWKRQKKEQAALEKQQEKAKYLDFEHVNKQEDLLQAIRQGLRRQQHCKPTEDQEQPKEQATKEEEEDQQEVEDDAMVQWLQAVANDGEDASAQIRMMTNGVYEVVGTGNFGSVLVWNCNLLKGKWCFEVFLKQTSGIIQLGWADGLFSANSATGDGVGDHHRSWAYDGLRQIILNDGKEAEYGAKWRQGDVVTCLLDLDTGVIGFCLNGKPLGDAFKKIGVHQQQTGFFPVISLEKDESIALNIGTREFQFPVAGYEPVFSALQPQTDPLQHPNSKKSTQPLAQDHPKVKDTEPKPQVELIDLLNVAQAEELHKLGIDQLKEQLQARGLKCGGTLEERAVRLFSIRGKKWEEIDSKIKAKGR